MESSNDIFVDRERCNKNEIFVFQRNFEVKKFGNTGNSMVTDKIKRNLAKSAGKYEKFEYDGVFISTLKEFFS